MWTFLFENNQYLQNRIMLHIGITGGIGTGKSFVSKIFKSIGIAFYDADKEAKEIMTKSQQVREALILAFGNQIYQSDSSLNRKWLSERVFKDAAQLAVLNGIVHPAVIQDAQDWANRQTGLYTLKEAALLFESGSYKSLDYTILVKAPLDLRIQRVMKRDGVSKEEVLNRIRKQMPEEEKEVLADFTIVNDEISALLPQIIALHKTLIGK